MLIFSGPHFQIPSKNARLPVATNFKLPSYGGILKKPQSLADLEAAARPTQHQPVAIKWLNDRSPYRTDSNPIYEDTGLTKYNDVRHLPYVLQQLNGHIQASNSGSTTQIDQTRFKSPPVILPLGMGKISIIFNDIAHVKVRYIGPQKRPTSAIVTTRGVHGGYTDEGGDLKNM